MPKVIGYGEDFLTFWAITERLDLILKLLEDRTDPTRCLVIYRPSFGRASLIGEFDAILVTPLTAYLVESKWDKSRLPQNVLKLSRVQMGRHEILRWYHETWDGEEWSNFVEKYEDAFFHRFMKSIAPTGSLLSQNLITVLSEMRGRAVKDVLLYFYVSELPKIETDFNIVRVRYRPTIGNYVELAS